jgi:competence protein ComEA
MSRITLSALAIAIGLVSAPLVFAQGGSATTPASSSTEVKAPAKATSSKHMAKVDLNSATREDLLKLPGINEAAADKIIAARPFKSREQLTSKGIVTKAEYSKLSSKITVRHLVAAK